MAATQIAGFSKTGEARNNYLGEPIYMVRDLLATSGERVHDIRNKKGQIFRATFIDNIGQAAIPQSFAITLVGNEGFEVATEEGGILRPATPQESHGQKIMMAFDETIAKYTELSRAALQERCKKAGIKVEVKFSNDKLAELLIATLGTKPESKVAGSTATIAASDEEVAAAGAASQTAAIAAAANADRLRTLPAGTGGGIEEEEIILDELE